MSERQSETLIVKLQALFDAIVGEAAANPAFAQKVEAALAAASGGAAEKARRPHPMLQNAAQSFDPLELHLEAALMSGHEIEARAFLGRLNRAELEAVVKAQRLPGANALQKAIAEAADPAQAVESIVRSAAQKARGRHLASS